VFGKGLLKGLSITFGHTFEKDLTIQYPEQQPFLQERYRGCLNFRFENCIVCGLCTKACPNQVLNYEAVSPPGGKKKALLTYTIDLQYCMFCNLCVEACPNDALYFSHDFELTRYRREDIKLVYKRPENMPLPVIGAAEEKAADEEKTEVLAQERDKKAKAVEAMKVALEKNPDKLLLRLVESEDDVKVLKALLAEDPKRLGVIAELLADDKDKAQKIARALVVKAKKNEAAKGGE